MVSKLCYLQPFKANRPTEDGIEVTFDCRRNVDPLKVRRRQRQHPVVAISKQPPITRHSWGAGEQQDLTTAKSERDLQSFHRSMSRRERTRPQDPTIQATSTVRAIDAAEMDGNGVLWCKSGIFGRLR